MKKAITYLLPLISLNSYAEHVLPTFSDLYFFNGSIQDMDSCSMPIYSYQFSDSSPKVIAEKVNATMQQYTDCTWREPINTGDSLDIPGLFPTTPDDWEKISTQDPSAPKPQDWEFDCIDKNGAVIHHANYTIQPQYTCPKGSRMDVVDVGCTTTPYVCDADVVGRDLNYPVLSVFGHVGLAVGYYPDQLKPGNYVLEVLNNDSVINVNSLSSFEHATSYWGEVYGLSGYQYISDINANQAIEAGWGQRLFDPQYTMTAQWQEGQTTSLLVLNSTSNQWIKQNGIIPAIFRCDTFVNYCYSKGFNASIPPSGIILPKSTYSSFQNQRTDVPPQATNNSVIKNQLQDNEYTLLDQQISTIHNDQTLDAKAKQKLFWNLIQQNKSDNEQFVYLLDNLQFEKATFLISDMINEYSQQNDINTKKQLQIAILQAALTFPKQTRTQEETGQIVAAQQFFIENLRDESNPALLKNFVLLAPSIIPTEAIQSLLKDGMRKLLANKDYLATNPFIKEEATFLQKVNA